MLESHRISDAVRTFLYQTGLERDLPQEECSILAELLEDGLGDAIANWLMGGASPAEDIEGSLVDIYYETAHPRLALPSFLRDREHRPCTESEKLRRDEARAELDKTIAAAQKAEKNRRARERRAEKKAERYMAFCDAVDKLQ